MEKENIDNAGAEDGWGNIGPDWADLSIFEQECRLGEDRERLDRYFQQVRDSAGFDVDDPPEGYAYMRPFPFDKILDERPLPEHLAHLEPHIKLIPYCAAYALEEYNKKSGKNLSLVEVVKANFAGLCGYTYWITLTAREEGFLDPPQTYLTQVFYLGSRKKGRKNVRNPRISIPVFRPKS